MKITPIAQKVLKQIFEENQADGLEASLQQSCHGLMPVLQVVRFEEGDQPETIDGIAVLMDENTQSSLENLTIDLQDGELVLVGFSECCGHEGCGCDEENHGEGCCGHCH